MTTIEQPEVALLHAAVREAKAGRKMAAHELLKAACAANPNDEHAWLWRASVSSDSKAAEFCLRRVLQINPGNSTAQQWLRKCRDRQQDYDSTYSCPFCNFAIRNAANRCPRCRAIVVLDLEAIASNSDVDELWLHRAIGYYKNQNQYEFQVRYFLALAYLQLFRSNVALEHLRAAFQIHRNHPAVVETMSILSARQVILVVDDSPTVRTIVSRTLERTDYRAEPTSSGSEALAALTELPISLVLLDISMPLVDGFQVCRRIRENPMLAKLPVIMLSGHDGFVDRVRARMAGATDYLIKPCEGEQLLAVVRKHLAAGASPSSAPRS